MLYDYHTHTAASFDGRDSLDAMAQAARNAGVAELAITDHIDLCGQKPESDCLVTEKEFERVRALYPDVSLVRGMELGQAHHDLSAADALMRDYQPEFTIGSLHNLKLALDFYFLTFNCAESAYEVLNLYVDELFELVAWGKFSVLGHLTYPLRYIPKELNIDFTRYYPRIVELFNVVIDKGLGIELNVAGMDRPEQGNRTHPDLPLLKLYRECGGEIITIGSDAHTADRVGANLQAGQALLREVGFTRLSRFTDGQLSFVAF
ncbi:MAG: histidinol-phosphatase HisJ family protein [Oscillospiraceae bacterium]|nr:histidinol-phosphatase HisJ family protein [Oscillospiraceae bacterium]